MRNPNGYGSVYRLTGKRRKPWAVRVTAGWSEQGKQIYKYLGTYASQHQAREALAEYNKAPGGLDYIGITFEGVYKLLTGSETFKRLSDNSLKAYQIAFEICAPLHSVKFRDIRTAQLEQVMTDSGKNLPTLKNVKLLYNQLYKTALRYDIVVKDYAKQIDMNAYAGRRNVPPLRMRK